MDQDPQFLIRVMFPDDIWNPLKVEAWKKDSTISSLICDVLMEYLKEDKDLSGLFEAFKSDFDNSNSRRRKVKCILEVFKLVSDVSIRYEEYRDLIISSICYDFLKHKEKHKE